MRRPAFDIIAVGTALALAGCVPAQSTGPSPTATPTASNSAAPTLERRPLMAYPDEPTVAWAFTAQDSGVQDDKGELSLVDPTLISWSVEGWRAPAPIDAGDTLVMAVWDLDGPATLVGIDADSGAVQWTYAPKRGEIKGCARDLLGSAVACNVEDADDEHAGLVLVDAGTGQELAAGEVPRGPVMLDAAGESVMSLTRDRSLQLLDADPEPYDVTAHDGSGTQLWSTSIVRQQNDVARGPSARIVAGPTLTAVELTGSVFVLSTDDGEVLLQRDGGYGHWYPAADGGGLLVDADPDQPAVTVVAPDGSEVATLEGFQVSGSILGEDASFVVDPDGQVMSVDTTTGATAGTGFTAPALTGYSASEFGGALVVLQDTGEDLPSISGHPLADPETQAWEHAMDGPFGAETDGTMLYISGFATGDGGAVGEDFAFSALDVTDGTRTWTRTVAFDDDAFQPTTVARAGGRLIVMGQNVMTALAP